MSVVMPVYNEQTHVGRALRSVLEQQYPHDRLEVLVVIGGRDGTRDVVSAMCAADGRVRIIDNEDPRTPVSLNLGIAAAHGSVIARVDGHGWIEPDYIAAGVELMRRTGADAVGGVARFVGEGPIGRAIALAMGSRLGAGTAAFRGAKTETEADGVMWGIYPRETFRRLGAFDESLLRNQDDELCYRIQASGGRMVVSPALRFSQTTRSSLTALGRQYHGWGRFRTATMLKHRRPATVRQVLPAALVSALGGAILWDLLRAPGRRWARSGIAAYAVGTLAAGTLEASRAGEPALAANVASAIAILQVAYGIGFWRELALAVIRFRCRR